MPTQLEKRAQAKIDKGYVFISYRNHDERPYVRTIYDDSMIDTTLGGWQGPFMNEDEAQEYIDSYNFDWSYLSGCGKWKVGYRLVYNGEPVAFHNSQRKIKAGETAEIIRDLGFSWRYRLRMDLDGLEIRPGSYVHWSRLFTEGSFEISRSKDGVVVAGDFSDLNEAIDRAKHLFDDEHTTYNYHITDYSSGWGKLVAICHPDKGVEILTEVLS